MVHQSNVVSQDVWWRPRSQTSGSNKSPYPDGGKTTIGPIFLMVQVQESYCLAFEICKILKGKEVLASFITCWCVILWQTVYRRITLCRGSNHQVCAEAAFLPVIKALQDVNMENLKSLLWTISAPLALYTNWDHYWMERECSTVVRRVLGNCLTCRMTRSDNGTNLTGGERDIREAINSWNQQKIEGYLQQKNIEWKSNPPGMSFMGGIWERVTRSVRKILGVLLTEQLEKHCEHWWRKLREFWMVNPWYLTEIAPSTQNL